MTTDKRPVRLWRIALVLTVIAATPGSLPARDRAPARDKLLETIRLTSPEQAAAMIKVPPGFHVSLFAAEPVVQQPIAMATDSRGRLWVCENNTYSDRTLNFDMSQHDRIVILEDTDHDGRADRHTVFWDRGQKLTSVELGFGGVWALCPPRLLFIPDRNRDDVPDSEPQVVLDGFDDGPVRHNIANGLRWGPDGWLYGRHGIQATSYVGAPGSLPSQRTPINCGIWRYHPVRKIFEVVCRGTTNPWGADWNERGELFFINTVIGHLWHAVPGAHFQRMYGEDDNPRLYGLMGQTADHFHWDTAESWSAINKNGGTPTTDQAGGGHAHVGLLIYQGTNWPDRYRGTLFTVNMHGRRLNNDRLERKGSAYVGVHGPDFLRTSDPWFRGLELVAGADGGVYLADWSDIGECHGNDGVHRASGRIYKIVYGRPQAASFADLAGASDAELVSHQQNKNEWFVRESRRILQDRAAAGQSMVEIHAALKKMFETDSDPVHKLRALWCLNVTGGNSDAWLLAQLGQEDESVRAWCVRLLSDGKAPSPAAVRAFSALVAREKSGLVLLYLASALQKLGAADRWPLTEKLTAHAEFAADRFLPLLIWYGIESVATENPAEAIRLAKASRMHVVTGYLARRLTEELPNGMEAVDRLVVLAADRSAPDRGRAILAGMRDALRGRRKSPAPPSWKRVALSWDSSPDRKIRQIIRDLSVVFGDGRALDDVRRIAASKGADLGARRDALRVLVEARAAAIAPLLLELLGDRDLGVDAARGLAAIDQPGIAASLVKNFAHLKSPTQVAVIITLCSRPAWAQLLLNAIAAGSIDRGGVPTFQIRQMAAFPGQEFHKRVLALWPQLKIVSGAKRQKIDGLKTLLAPSVLAAADAPRGRKRFNQTCATCHTLFGQGNRIGPDLTGSQRSNLDYLLENIVDPSSTVVPAYRMSTVVLADGRVLNGILGDRRQSIVALQTPTEKLAINNAEIESVKLSQQSLMPDGLLDVLSQNEIRDLIAYLMSPRQVPLPANDRPLAENLLR